MSKAYIEYHWKYTWHGREYTGHHCYPVGTDPEAVKREQMPGTSSFEMTHLEWPAYAWPGGYEIHYITKDCGVLCHQCANKELERTLDPEDEQFFIVAADCNYEDADLYCDHCNRRIEPAYGDDE